MAQPREPPKAPHLNATNVVKLLALGIFLFVIYRETGFATTTLIGLLCIQQEILIAWTQSLHYQNQILSLQLDVTHEMQKVINETFSQLKP